MPYTVEMVYFSRTVHLTAVVMIRINYMALLRLFSVYADMISPVKFRLPVVSGRYLPRVLGSETFSCVC